ncbi:MAG: hypothetical protein MJZ19_11235 [Paludibacteraceae bacterium]|nr:hypothetical protein [Paludibacteraceae bacterium]
MKTNIASSHSYPLRYLSGNLMKISHKLTESYVISRIWHKLDRTDVYFVFQQKVQRDEDKYALTDLYLPQLGIVVEVNEPFHYQKREKIADDADRNDDVERVANAKVFKVDCQDTLDGIHRQIDEIVAVIKQRIVELGDNFVPWGESWFTPEYHKKKGVLKVSEKPSVATIDEVAEIFNTVIKHKGFLRPGAVDLPNKPNMSVWWPNTKNPKWLNEYIVEEDGAYIRECPKDESKVKEHLDTWFDRGQRRITFLRYKDSLAMEYYRFIGVFELDKNRSRKEGMCMWRRISDTYDLNR